MAEVDDVLRATVDAITAAVPELNGYAYVVPSVTIPAVVAFPPDEITYGESMSGDGTMLYVVRLFAGRAQDGSDQARLNAYISRKGDRSVIEALEADPTLGGVVADVSVIAAVNYGNWPVGSTTYLGVEVRLRAMLS